MVLFINILFQFFSMWISTLHSYNCIAHTLLNPMLKNWHWCKYFPCDYVVLIISLVQNCRYVYHYSFLLIADFFSYDWEVGFKIHNLLGKVVWKYLYMATSVLLLSTYVTLSKFQASWLTMPIFQIIHLSFSWSVMRGDPIIHFSSLD